MPRIARIPAPGTVLHVVSRFIDRGWFMRDDEDRATYLRLLGRALLESDWVLLAYALMSSHIHLGLVGGKSKLRSWIQRVHSPFANWINHRYGRIGPLFAGRPKEWRIRPEHEASLIAYIHNNPVRAGLVQRARESSWTSHRAYVGEVLTPPWLAVEQGLERCGLPRDRFDAWVDNNPSVVSDDQLRDMFAAARRRGGLTLGTPTSKPTEVPLLARQHARIRPALPHLLEVVSSITGVPWTAFASRRIDAALREARKLAVHAGSVLGLTGSELADGLGVSPQTTSRLRLEPLTEHEKATVSAVVERLTIVWTDGDPPVAYSNPYDKPRPN